MGKFRIIIKILLYSHIFYYLIDIKRKNYEYPEKVIFNSKEFNFLFNNINFIGNWKSLIKSDLLDISKGIILFHIRIKKSKDKLIKYEYYGIINIFSNYVFEEKKYKIDIKLDDFDYKNLSYLGNTKKFSVYYKLDNQIIKKEIKCNLKFKISFNPRIINKSNQSINTKLLLKLDNSLKINIKNQENNFNFNIISDLSFENYNIFDFIILIILLILLIMIIVKKNNNGESLENYVIILNICFDFFFSILNLFILNDLYNNKYNNINICFFIILIFLILIVFYCVDIKFYYLLFNNDINYFNEFLKILLIYTLFSNILFTFYISIKYILIIIILIIFYFHFFSNELIMDLKFIFYLYLIFLRKFYLYLFSFINKERLINSPSLILIFNLLSIFLFSFILYYTEKYYGIIYILPKFFLNLNENHYLFFDYEIKEGIENKVIYFFIIINRIY